jgi:hypothetical protein
LPSTAALSDHGWKPGAEALKRGRNEELDRQYFRSKFLPLTILPAGSYVHPRQLRKDQRFYWKEQKEI